MKVGSIIGMLVSAAVLSSAMTWAAPAAKPKVHPPLARQVSPKLRPPVSPDPHMVHGYGGHPARLDHMNIAGPGQKSHVTAVKPTARPPRPKQKW